MHPLRRAASAVLVAGAALVAGGCPKPVPPAPPPPAVFVPPLHDADVGEELRLRRGEDQWVWRVASATDEEVEIDLTKFRGDAVESRERIRWARNGFGLPPGYVVRKILRDRLEHGGRTYDCWILKAHSRTDVRWYWVSDEVPVSGFVKIAREERGQPIEGDAAALVPEASSFGR